MPKILLFILPITLLLFVILLSSKECGFDADFIRLGGHNISDKRCECKGIIAHPPFWEPMLGDGLSHYKCYGVKVGETKDIESERYIDKQLQIF